jgi:hypothetical protein
MWVVGPGAPFFSFFPVSFSLFPNPNGITHGIPTDTFPLEDNLFFTKKEKDQLHLSASSSLIPY